MGICFNSFTVVELLVSFLWKLGVDEDHIAESQFRMMQTYTIRRRS